MKKYSHIFFDLDHTLWDFERNSTEALTEIFQDLRLDSHGVPAPEPFITNYQEHNHRCWEMYRKGEISKEDLRTHRFVLALNDFKITDYQLAKRIGDEYVKISPYKTNLFSGSIEILEYLDRRYKLSIITNGFEEVQYIKIKQSGLEKYFDHIITSEKAGFKKPHPAIFKMALELNDASPESVLMIGDDEEADVLAAVDLGIDGILFDPHKKSKGNEKYNVINELKELRRWL